MLFSPYGIAITSLGEERADLSAFRTFVRFVLVWSCRFPLPFWVWEELRFVIVALPGLFSYLFLITFVVSVCGEGVEKARDEIKRLDSSVQNYLEAYEDHISSGPLVLKVRY